MGQLFECRCADCAAEFRMGFGGTMQFEDARCRHCANKTAFLRSFVEPHDSQDRREDWIDVQRRFRSGEITVDQYHQRVEELLGPCAKCGGRYGVDAPPRCPQCRSTNVVRGELILHYD